jgi:hypothetical protein
MYEQSAASKRQGYTKLSSCQDVKGIGQDYLIKNMSLGQGRSEVKVERTSNPRR